MSFLLNSKVKIKESRILKPNFKISPNNDAKIVQLKGFEGFSNFINHATALHFPYLFVFIVETKDFYDEKIKEAQDKLIEKFNHRPLILEFKNEKESKLFYKEKGDYEENQKFVPESDNQFSGIYREIPKTESGKLENILSQIYNSKSELSIRSLLLYSFDLNDKFSIALKFIDSYENLDIFMAAFDLPFDYIQPIIPLDSQRLILCVDPEGESFLSTLIFKNNLTVVRFLLSNFRDVFDYWGFEYKKKKTKEFASFGPPYKDTYLLFIENDFPFPDETNYLDSKVIAHRLELHKLLEENKTNEEIKEFVREKKLKGYVYNLENKTFLSQLLLDKNNSEDVNSNRNRYDLYGYLKSLGFEASSDELKDKSQIERNKIDEYVFKHASDYTHNIEDYLASKSKLHERGLYHKFNSDALRELHMSQISQIFKDVCKIPEVKKIAKVVAQPDIKFHFDFFEKTIHKVIVGGQNTLGQTRPNRTIIIGARDPLVARQTLAHEMTHLAMLIVYENNYLPYSWDDIEKCNAFHYAFSKSKSEAAKYIDANGKIGNEVTDEIVPRVWACYQDKSKTEAQLIATYKAELIVRVPEMLTRFYNPDTDQYDPKIDLCRQSYGELFNYFEEFTVPDLDSYDAESASRIEVLNMEFGVTKKFKQNIEFDVDLNLNFNNMLIESKVPKMVLNQMRFIHERSSTLFVNPKKFKHEQVLKHYCELFKNPEKPVKATIVLDFSSGNTEGTDKILKNILNNSKIKVYFVTNPEHKEKAQNFFAEHNLEYTEAKLTHSWDDLKLFTKEVIKLQEVEFNGVKFTLENFLKEIPEINESEFFTEAMLDAYMSGKKFKIEAIEASENIYIGRKFIKRVFSSEPEIKSADDFGLLYDTNDFHKKFYYQIIEGQSENTYKIYKIEYSEIGENDFDDDKNQNFEIFEAVKGKNVVLLSGAVGEGKTHTLRRLQNSLSVKFYLIYYIELKKYLDILSKLQESIENLNFEAFFKTTFLKDKTKFEKALFEVFYNKDKVFFFLDGYDEIYPQYSVGVIKLINLFKNSEKCQLWITTRSHLENELRKNLNLKEFLSFEAFDEKRKEEVKNFIIKYFKYLLKVGELIEEPKKENDAKNQEMSLQIQKPEIVNNAKTPEKKNSETEEHAEKLMENLISGTKSETYIGIPQLLKLFADACIVDKKIDKKFLENFTKHQIFKRAINKKIVTWGQKYGLDENIAVIMSRFVGRTFSDLHEFYAFKSLEFELETDFAISLNKMWDNEEIIKCGIITSFNNNSVSFQHETLRDFYIADFVVKGLERNEHWLYHEQNLNYIIKFLEDSPKFHVVNMFISGGIHGINILKQESKMKKIAKCFENILKSSKRRFLTTAIIENYTALKDFLLAVFKNMDKNVKLQQIKDELIFDEKVLRIRIHKDSYKIKCKNYRSSLDDLIEDEQFIPLEKEELNALLDEFLYKLYASSPFVKTVDALKDTLEEYKKKNSTQ